MGRIYRQISILKPSVKKLSKGAAVAILFAKTRVGGSLTGTTSYVTVFKIWVPSVQLPESLAGSIRGLTASLSDERESV